QFLRSNMFSCCLEGPPCASYIPGLTSSKKIVKALPDCRINLVGAGRDVFWSRRQLRPAQTPRSPLTILPLIFDAYSANKSLCFIKGHPFCRSEPEKIGPIYKFWIHAIRVHGHIDRTSNSMFQMTATPPCKFCFATEP